MKSVNLTHKVQHNYQALKVAGYGFFGFCAGVSGIQAAANQDLKSISAVLLVSLAGLAYNKFLDTAREKQRLKQLAYTERKHILEDFDKQEEDVCKNLLSKSFYYKLQPNNVKNGCVTEFLSKQKLYKN